MTKLTDRELDDLESEEDFLRHYDRSRYASQSLTADIAIFTIKNEALSLLLVQRGGHPDKGKWALPGGFVEPNETIDQAAARELREETGLTVEEAHLEQLRTYATPHRDPRGYTATVAHVALIPKLSNPKAGDDAHDAQFFPVNEVLNSLELAFDHRTIIEDGIARVRAKLEYAPLAPKFLDNDTFTIPELMRVYETVWGQTFDHPSNFRRKVKSVPGFLLPVGERGAPSFQGGRSTDLYRLGPIDIIYPPLQQRDVHG